MQNKMTKLESLAERGRLKHKQQFPPSNLRQLHQYVLRGDRELCRVILFKVMLLAFSKSSQTAAWQLEWSHSNRGKVEID